MWLFIHILLFVYGVVHVECQCAAGQYNNGCPTGWNYLTDAPKCWAIRKSNSKLGTSTGTISIDPCPTFDSASTLFDGTLDNYQNIIAKLNTVENNCPYAFWVGVGAKSFRNNIGHGDSWSSTCAVLNQWWTGTACSGYGVETKWCTDEYYSICKKTVTCTNCDAGKSSAANTANAASCSNCPAGQISAAGGLCGNCAAGQTSSSPFTACADCGVNTYAASGAGSCTPCPDHSSSPAKSGAVGSCICNAGASGANGGPCTQCTPGRYKSSTGAAVCSECGAGTSSAATGVTAESTCTDCDRGKFSTGAASACTPCNAGYYQGSTGQNNCNTPCDAGQFSTGGASTCTSCSEGYYQGSQAQGNCNTPCDPGKFSTGGAAVCTPCSAGYYQESQAQNNCNTPCAVGKFSTGGASVCTDCNPGYYQGSQAQNNCNTPCAVGKYSLGGASTCTDCNPGYYQPAQGKSTCTQCEPGKYQTTAGVTVCTNCASGFYSATTAATTISTCLTCKPGNYSTTGATACSICIAGKYTNISAASTCTKCVGEQAYAPNTGMTTCFQCIDKRQISDPNKTYCFTCNDGEYEDRPNGVCLPCPVGTYSDGTTNRKCKACRSGTYAATPKTAVCDKCKACPDSFYRINCTVTAGGGYCQPCPTCDKKEVRVDCMNRAGHNNESGVCRLREFTVRNPFCDLQGAGHFLGGYPFQELFGTSQDLADFQCRGICDGVTNRLTEDMKTESNLVQYKNQSFDSGYCKGPYACDVPTCVIYGVSDDSQPAYRLPAACPVIIDDTLSGQLWSVTKQPNYKLDPLTIAVQHMRYSVECQACSTCGQMPTDVLKVWPLMQNYTDWGRGCARECTELSCELDEIFDWTVSDATAKCKKCSELEDVRLCTSKQQQGFASSDISGNLPKLTFKDCLPKRIIQYGIPRASYGDCLRCPEVNDACTSPGLYYATCDTDLNIVCKACDAKATASSSYFNGTSTNILYCQQTLCTEDRTGVTFDVLPHRICHRQCSRTRCASDRVELPCLLPHDKRCKASIAYTDFPVDEMYKKQGYVPAHANVLERVSGLHLFSNFENVLLSVDSIPLQKRRVCVWNANGITDNDMNPAGISKHFEEECRPWNRDAGTIYPLLPMQNTVTDTTDFQRRILLNTSAIAMHYLSQWHHVESIPNAFTGDVFLDLELANTSHVALVTFISPDRLLSNITSVVRWHVSIYAHQTVGEPGDVLIRIDTPDDFERCDECFSLTVACVAPNCTRVASTSNSSLSCSTASHSAFRTAPVATAWQDFCGDKFHVSVPTGKMYVCDASMQQRVRWQHTPSHTALSVLAGILDPACADVSIFSVQLSTSQVLLGATEALPGKHCLGFVFSNTSVFCVSVSGVLQTVSDSKLHPNVFTIRSVVVFQDSLIITVGFTLSQSTTSYVYNISSVCATLSTSITARVSNTISALTHIRDPIFMLATGNPLYFLSRVDTKTDRTMTLRKYICGDVLLMISTFCESDAIAVELFSGKLPYIDTENTLLHAKGDTLLFLTSTIPPLGSAFVLAVLVSPASVTRKSVELTLSAQEKVYPNDGETNRISGVWITNNVYILALEKQQQVWRLSLDSGVAFTLLPPVNSIFSYSFIVLGGAVMTKTPTAYTLTTCMSGCVTSTSDTATYFAFGNETLTYKRLLSCLDTNLSHVDALQLQQTPTETCAVAEFNRSLYAMQYSLSLKCKQASGVISLSATLEVGAVMRITAKNTSKVLTANASQLVFMYAQCLNSTAQYIELFDHFTCAEGCMLYQVTQVQITGKVHINYVLHSVLPPSDSMIYTLLRSSTYAPPRSEVATSFDSWTQHSTFTHTMTDLQRIQVNVMRKAKELFVLSETTHVALDVLQVVPTLNIQAVFYMLATNVSVLLTLLHIPTEDDLAELALLDSTLRGNEIYGWRRLHATAFVRSAGASLMNCVYDLRLVAVDDRFNPRQESSKIGCRIRLQGEGVNAVGRCHLEIPSALANAARVVGLMLYPGTCVLPPPDSLSIELNPFTSMSECVQHQYLDADDAKCVSCEKKDVICGPGFYAAGCEAMLWESNLVTCLSCPRPARAIFTNTSLTCNDWICEASFFRSDSLCLNCTTSLQNVCVKTPGQMWAACTGLSNEKCMNCPLSLLPRNAEWTNTSECAWKCRASYFNNNGICEACLSLKILKSVLSIQGSRTPGQFYKFRPCTESRQAESSTCQFQQRLNVTYTGDATEFLDDCPVRCAEYLHKVSTTVTDSQNATWKATQCIECPLSSQPTYLNASLVPRSAYDMDIACSATCRLSSEHYPVEGNGTRCAYCPVGRCPAGQYTQTADGCTSCLNCTSYLQGAFVFQREGLVNNNASCQEMCAPGYYLADDGVQCLPHTDVQCVTGQFKVNGTARTDARCDECTDCTGYRQVRACSLTQDAQCESCGPLVWWSSFWNGTECDLACRPAYTKLYMPRARCQRCSPCPNGFQRVPQPANCSDCAACSPPKPQHSEYISQCAWKCEKYHILHLDDETGMPHCIYSVEWATNVPAPPARRQYNVSCTKGQKLTDQLLCADCLTPSGLNQSDLNIAWMWTDVGCAWQCVPGLMHVINTTSQQNSCLTRSQYLALVVTRRVPHAPFVKSLNYSLLLMVVVPLTFVLLSCGLRKHST